MSHSAIYPILTRLTWHLTQKKQRHLTLPLWLTNRRFNIALDTPSGSVRCHVRHLTLAYWQIKDLLTVGMKSHSNKSEMKHRFIHFLRKCQMSRLGPLCRAIYFLRFVNQRDEKPQGVLKAIYFLGFVTEGVLKATFHPCAFMTWHLTQNLLGFATKGNSSKICFASGLTSYTFFVTNPRRFCVRKDVLIRLSLLQIPESRWLLTQKKQRHLTKGLCYASNRRRFIVAFHPLTSFHSLTSSWDEKPQGVWDVWYTNRRK